MDAYIAGAEVLVDERIAYAQAHGLSPRVGAPYRVPDAPWRFVFHSTNIGSVGATDDWGVAQCRRQAIQHRNPPHLWASWENNWVGQTVPLNRAAYALNHASTDPETNHRHAIQVEVFGYAERGLRNPALCDWLGRRVLGPVIRAGVPINLGHLAPSAGADAYGPNGSVRQTWAWWATFDGVCGHQNVPGNVHWDPGVSDYRRIAQAARREPVQPPPSEEDDDMVLIRTAEPNRAAFVVGGKLIKVSGEANAANARAAGVPVFYVENDEWDRFAKAFPYVG